MSKLHVIVFEGASNVGKSTLINRYKDYLETQGKEVSILNATQPSYNVSPMVFNNYFPEVVNDKIASLSRLHKEIKQQGGFYQTSQETRVTLIEEAYDLMAYNLAGFNRAIEWSVKNNKDYLFVDRSLFSTTVYNLMSLEVNPNDYPIIQKKLKIFANFFTESFTNENIIGKLVHVYRTEPLTSATHSEGDAYYDEDSAKRFHQYIENYGKLTHQYLQDRAIVINNDGTIEETLQDLIHKLSF